MSLCHHVSLNLTHSVSSHSSGMFFLLLGMQVRNMPQLLLLLQQHSLRSRNKTTHNSTSQTPELHVSAVSFYDSTAAYTSTAIHQLVQVVTAIELATVLTRLETQEMPRCVQKKGHPDALC